MIGFEENDMLNEICRFANACIEKGKFEADGDEKNGNICYKRIHELYWLLKSENRLDELSVLLEHKNPYVRLWASAYTLQIDSASAEKVLEELTLIKKDMVGFTAEITLQEWRSGRLRWD
jgi:hypothetical protein